jgi:hypothetical protein
LFPLGALFRAIQKEQHRRRRYAFISPCGPHTIRDDDIALFEMNGFAIIKLPAKSHGRTRQRSRQCWSCHFRVFFFKVIG